MKRIAYALIFLFLNGCKSNHPDYVGTIYPKHSVDELWINGGEEAQSLDLHKTNGEYEQNMINNMFVRLVQFDPETRVIVPDLAKSWNVSKDGREYTFQLRQDAFWSDGTPITADDVEWSWKRLMDPATGAPAADIADVIENAVEFRTGKKDSKSVGIRAVDEHTFWVKLKQPVAYFLGQIEHMAFAPLPRHLIEKFQMQDKENQWTDPENIVVSGAFKLTENKFKQYKIFEKNERYYNADKVRLKKVKSLVITDHHWDVNAYKTGQHDWSCCNGLPLEMTGDFASKKDFHRDQIFSTYFFMTNTTKKPLNDPRVRRALSLAIDRKSIVDYITKGGQIPSLDFVPTGALNYPGIQSKLFDPTEATRLLAESGFKDGNNFPKLTVKFNTAADNRIIAEAVQQMWKKNLNVDVELSNEEWSVFMADQKSGNFQIARRTWNGDYVDPYAFLSLLTSDGSSNKSGWKNKKYDALIVASNLESDAIKRFKFFQEAEKILADEQPYIPLYFLTHGYLKKPYLKGFWPNIQNHHEWKFMWIDPAWVSSVPANVSQMEHSWLEGPKTSTF